MRRIDRPPVGSALRSSFRSLPVAVGPGWTSILPDDISANLSPDAWSPTPAVPRSAYACFFLLVIGLPQMNIGSASRYYPRTRLFTGLPFRSCRHSITFRPLSLLTSPVVPTAAHVVQGSRGFYVRAYRALLPPHAPDMLAARIQAIGGAGTFTRPDSQPCRLLHSPRNLSSSRSICCQNWIRAVD
jgi:hypothetical protein